MSQSAHDARSKRARLCFAQWLDEACEALHIDEDPEGLGRKFGVVPLPDPEVIAVEIERCCPEIEVCAGSAKVQQVGSCVEFTADLRRRFPETLTISFREVRDA